MSVLGSVYKLNDKSNVQLFLDFPIHDGKSLSYLDSGAQPSMRSPRHDEAKQIEKNIC